MRLRFYNQAAHRSPRNFERVFIREVGTTPLQYVLQMRVEGARQRLERMDKGFKQVASAVGFGSVDSMRRAFVRRLGITPRRNSSSPRPGVIRSGTIQEDDGTALQRAILTRPWRSPVDTSRRLT